MNNDYITVTQLTRYIKYKIDNDSNLNKIYLKGEISNFKAHTRGHFYFTLKDENSRINAVMFSTYANDVKFDLQDGMKVLVTGRVSVYEATGGYQIYVDSIVEDGIGKLYIAFEQLKKKLAAEGLFLESHKKKIPRIPNRIGIITAPTGAAIKDILSTLKRRWPLCETILFPSLVQGAEAAADIVRNIELSKNYDLDLLIIGRGGGSIEDLWCFNEEIVARAIYALDTPVISAVGHETDFTIIDFVSDLRAPTPSAAAELLTKDTKQSFGALLKDISRISRAIDMFVADKTTNFVNDKQLLISEAENLVEDKNQKLKKITNKLSSKLDMFAQVQDYQLKLKLAHLNKLNPLDILSLGYAKIEQDGKCKGKLADLDLEKEFDINFVDGKIVAKGERK